MASHTKDPSGWDVLGQGPRALDPEDFDAEDMSGIEGERVAKALARAGVASRREVERYIEAGRVRLNGHVLTTPAVKVAPGDILTVDGQVVADAEPTRMWRYHKPVDLVTTHKDPQGRPTVFEALPPGLPRVISVGRLDINSEGLLLLTNDGALARALELPSSGWNRTYRARAYGDTTQEKLDRLLKGVTVEGVKYGPITAKLDKVREGKRHTNVWITVTIAEGKNRPGRKGAGAAKALGNHPTDGKAITLRSGRFGPYVQHGQLRATLPKDMDATSVSVDSAIALLAAKAAKEGGPVAKAKAKGKVARKSADA